MCKILLSIKPEYAEKIFAGTKKYEFRRVVSKRQPSKIVVYTTSPVCRVIGEVAVNKVICESPSKLWDKTRKSAGISRQKFYSYFSGKEVGYAFALAKTKKYKTPKFLSDFGISQAPQSFVYLS